MVSIITVNYNGVTDTCELIDSFARLETYPYEIIVVDNGSAKPEGDEIEARYPGVKVVRNINNGFAGGNNAGLEAAAGDYIFFLNNDTVIREPILEKLVARLENSKIGGVSPMIKYLRTPDKIQYAGFTELTHITLRNKSIGHGQTDTGQYREASQTAYMHGAAMMVRRDVIERVGPMTEVYFLYYEELDWSIRIAQAGYRLWFEPAAVVYHKDGTGTQKSSPLREYYMSRARLLFARRNISGMNKLLSYSYIVCVAAPRKIIVHLLHKEPALAKAVAKGISDGLTMAKD